MELIALRIKKGQFWGLTFFEEISRIWDPEKLTNFIGYYIEYFRAKLGNSIFKI